VSGATDFGEWQKMTGSPAGVLAHNSAKHGYAAQNNKMNSSSRLDELE
jgi:hypothetical protein